MQLAADEPVSAIAAVEPVLAGRAFAFHTNQVIEALLIDGLARTRMGEREAAERSVERALDLAEPQGHVWIWLTVAGARELLAEHPPHRTAHAAYLRTLLDHLEGAGPTRAEPEALADPLNERELTVLRFLPTNLSAVRDRRRAVPVGQHGQDAHAQAVLEARRPHAGRGGRARAGARTARAVAARLSFTRIV